MRNPGTLIVVAFALLFLGWLFTRRPESASLSDPSKSPPLESSVSPPPSSPARHERWLRTAHKTEPQSAEQVVADKVARFARSRRELAAALAKRHGVTVPPEVERFFAAVESGDWTQIQETFNAINGGDSSTGHTSRRSPGVSKLWPAIIDAFGVAEQANLMPPQVLLDYGYSILDSLEPGMVYVGGTDSSRWVPALLNDTEEGQRHVVITQNGLADSSYLDYLRLQFDGRLNTLTEADSQEAFQNYLADARRRLEHDQQFPNEPKQIRHAEEVKMVDGKLNVGGRTAVFDINERLLKKLLEKNPDLSFAVGESIPMPGTYSDAVPLGPLMELRSNTEFTPERAAESLEYWRAQSEFALSDSETSRSEPALKNYSHDSVASANLLAARGFTTEAEEAYQIARKLWPANPEPIVNLSQLYQRTGRAEQGRQLLEQFARAFPDQRQPIQDNWGIVLSKPDP